MTDFITYLWANFVIGMLSFGGGKGYIPMFENIYVQTYHIVNHLQLTQLVGYALSLPGPIAPMIAGPIGYEKFGYLGFVLGLLVLMVPAILMFFLTWKIIQKKHDSLILQKITKYMSPAILALLLSVVIKSLNVFSYGMHYFYYSIAVFMVSSVLFIYTKIHPFIVIVIFGVGGFFIL